MLRMIFLINRISKRLKKRSNFMDVLSNRLSISAKKELLCCTMGKRCHFDVTFWLLMVGDWQASFSANEQPYFTYVFDTILVRIRF